MMAARPSSPSTLAPTADARGEREGPPGDERRGTVEGARRYDLDWIRVGAFGLLIAYHVGMFYVPWEWHVKSPRQSEVLTLFMFLTNPWRLPLLFLVSGAATRFLMDKVEGFAFLRSRTARLLPPLLFGMFVVVPPQTYYELVEKLPAAVASGWGDFWVKYATASGQWCPDVECLITPTWNHLWFVAYLWVYTLVLGAIGPLVRRMTASESKRPIPIWMLLGLPVIGLAVLRIGLFPIFDVTHALVDDWYTHAVSLPLFLFGFATARSDRFRETFIRARWVSALLWTAAYACWAVYAWTYRADDANPPEALRTVGRVLYAVQQWTAIAAILGFGARWLDRPSRALRYLTDAVFPVYLVHQTIIVVAAHHLASWRLPLVVEVATLLAVTVVGCAATYELARRVGPLRPLFGLRPAARAVSANAEAGSP